MLHGHSVCYMCERMFVAERIDWSAVRAFYAQGHSQRQTREKFGFGGSSWARAVARGDLTPRQASPSRPRSVTRERVATLLARGLSQAEIARELGISTPTVCHHVRRLGILSESKFRNRYDWRAVQRAYDSGLTAAECAAHFGFSRASWSQAVSRGDIRARPRAEPIESILAAGRPRSRNHVKRRLIDAGLKGTCCESCGLDTWLEQPIGLELHHINGDGDDNRLENLQLLCGNCHAQTPNWGARNKGKRAA